MVNPKLLSEFVMALPLQKPGFAASPEGAEAISPAQSLAYMGDMLENMRKIAQAQGLGVLAHLLELTRAEARLAARDQIRDHIRPPAAHPLHG